MLTISDEQMQHFKEDREVSYSIPKLCEHLRQNYSYTHINQLPEKELIEQIKQAVDIAGSYGLWSQRDMYTFVTWELTQYPGFHRHKKVQDLLQDSGGHPKMRMYWLARQLPAPVWLEVS